MSDDTPTRTAAPDAEDAVTMLAELRARVEDATGEIDRLTAELEDRTRDLDELETTTDALLGVTDTPVVVVGEDRRVRALTRGAADLLGTSAAAVGRALSTILPDDLADEVAKCLDDDHASSTGAVLVERLEGGGALVVLRPT